MTLLELIERLADLGFQHGNLHVEVRGEFSFDRLVSVSLHDEGIAPVIRLDTEPQYND